MQVREIIMITNSWNKTEGESISQKVMGKVKPDAPLKNRINFAQKQLEVQITKLTGINEKLQTKHDKIFEKVVIILLATMCQKFKILFTPTLLNLDP